MCLPLCAAILRTAQSGAALGTAERRVQAGSDEGSESGDELDDAAMEALDGVLRAQLRSMVLGRGRAATRERSATLLPLQLRTAALLDDWVKKVWTLRRWRWEA